MFKSFTLYIWLFAINDRTFYSCGIIILKTFELNNIYFSSIKIRRLKYLYRFQKAIGILRELAIVVKSNNDLYLYSSRVTISLYISTLGETIFEFSRVLGILVYFTTPIKYYLYNILKSTEYNQRWCNGASRKRDIRPGPR